MNDPQTTRELTTAESKGRDNESTDAADQVREDLAGLRTRAQERECECEGQEEFVARALPISQEE